MSVELPPLHRRGCYKGPRVSGKRPCLEGSVNMGSVVSEHPLRLHSYTSGITPSETPVVPKVTDRVAPMDRVVDHPY